MKISFVIFYLLGIFVLSGCTVINMEASDSLTAFLEPQTIMKFKDVPVPIDFELIPSDSYAFESAGTRVAVLKYYGKTDPDLLMDFYKTKMEEYGWHLLNVVEYGQRLLNFEKENEVCIVNITPRFNLVKFNYVIINLSLGPKSKKAVLTSEQN